MKVHNKMGPGFQEVIYQRCLAIELERANLSFVREQEQTVYYDGIEVGTRRADFGVENQVVLELKAFVQLEDVHLAQAKNYTRGCPMDKLEHYRTCIQTLLEKHSQSKPRNEDVENELFFDSTRDHCQLMRVG